MYIVTEKWGDNKWVVAKNNFALRDYIVGRYFTYSMFLENYKEIEYRENKELLEFYQDEVDRCYGDLLATIDQDRDNPVIEWDFFESYNFLDRYMIKERPIYIEIEE